MRLPRGYTLLLAALLSFAVLAIGSVPEWVLLADAFLAAALLGATIWLRDERGLAWDFPAVVGAFLLVWTLLQVIPLPRMLLSWVAPANAGISGTALAPMGIPMRNDWMPISLDITATWWEVVKSALYLAVYLAVFNLARRAGSHGALLAVAASGIALALVSLGHVAGGFQDLYGFYRSREVMSPPVLSPLLNMNHLAGYLCLATPIALGLGLDNDNVARRWLWFIGAAISAAILLLGLSRGGIACFFGGMVLFALILRLRRSRGTGRPWVPWGVAVGVALGIYVGSDDISHELTNADVGKLRIVRESLPLLGDHFAVGVGRGAFGAVFPAYLSRAEPVTYTHAEVLPVQLAADWGVPVATLAIAVAIWALWRAFVATRLQARNIGAGVGLVALGVQNLVDFGLEIPGVGVAAVATLAALLGSHGAAGQPALAHIRRPWPNYALATALAAVASLGASNAWGRSATREGEKLMAAALSTEVPSSQFQSKLREAIVRHPADPYLPFLGGVRAEHTREPRALAWLNRAIERRPRNGQAHLIAARVLVRAGFVSQATLEYRLAAMDDSRLVGIVANEVVRRWANADAAIAAAPPGRDGLPFLNAAAARLDGLAAESALVDREMLIRDPNHPGALWREGQSALRAGATARATIVAERLRRAWPERPDGYLLQADSLRASGRTREERRVLEEGLVRADDPRPLLAQLAVSTAAAGDMITARLHLNRLHDIAAGDGAAAIAAFALEGDVEASAKNLGRAMRAYSRANSLTGDEQQFLGRMAEIAERAGDLHVARDAYVELARLHPDEPRYREKAQQLSRTTTRPLDQTQPR